jgi:hypothetical protein
MYAYIIRFWIIVSVSVAYNFQAGNNKLKLFTEYESVTQNVSFENSDFVLYIIQRHNLHFHIS